MNGSIERYPTPLPVPFSKAVRAGGFLFLSGVLPMDASGQIVAGDIAVQTRAVLERIAATLGELGAGLADVVRVTVWLADLGDFAAFNDEYRRHFAAADLPARSTVQATLYKGARIEIEAQALAPYSP
jgi:2-iminobutanoate/2-iminopropanoate deaminase